MLKEGKWVLSLNQPPLRWRPAPILVVNTTTHVLTTPAQTPTNPQARLFLRLDIAVTLCPSTDPPSPPPSI